MVWRYLSDGRKYFSVTFVLAVVGVALGVAALVLAMAVVSGYETTLRNSVINMQGHMMISRRGGVENDYQKYVPQIQKLLPELVALSPFVQLEGLLVHNKKLAGVALEGVEPETIGFVLALEKSLTAGRANLISDSDIPFALIGKGIAKNFNLQVGDEFKLVVPITRAQTASGFKPKVQKFKVSGVLDLGRTDYDERFILSDLKTAQNFGELGHRISGWRVKLNHYSIADAAAQRVEDALKYPFWVRSWTQANQNLFQAVRYEKAVIFVIVLLMVVAAAFNVSSTLFLSVVRRYSQISILKAMGVSQSFIRKLFTQQGLIIGFLGSTIGLTLGWLGCRVFIWAEKHWGLFPGEVYKLDFVELEIRFLDVVFILASTMLICYISTLAPAFKGAKLPPVEGLRYE